MSAAKKKRPALSPEVLAGKVMAHPMRVAILGALEKLGKAASPNYFAKAFGVPVSHTAYHFKVLAASGAIALERTEPRRGATEHFYKLTGKLTPGNGSIELDDRQRGLLVRVIGDVPEMLLTVRESQDLLAIKKTLEGGSA